MVTVNPPEDLSAVVQTALREDIGPGDITASIIDSDIRTCANVVARESAILCGSPWFNEAFQQVDHTTEIEWFANEGGVIAPEQRICTVRGTATALLIAERTALNFLQSLSGTATVTRRYVDAVAPFATRILDTRKTIPGLRSAQKYAVRMGGGTNHRSGLYDGVLIKENHQVISQSLQSMVDSLIQRHIKVELIEVEIESLNELETAIASGANRVMLDNFSISDIAEAVRRNNRRVELEASGNVNLETVPAVAETGVDFISIGALTKHLRAIDFSMLFDDHKYSERTAVTRTNE